ncbi:hypothetical protein NQZ68_007190 [Dissostichus eleginoides]|nr:hypothetical protein NQZ68_007190 [Dissostichus eleginoides]
MQRYYSLSSGKLGLSGPPHSAWKVLEGEKLSRKTQIKPCSRPLRSVKPCLAQITLAVPQLH